jgi:hypothetical protein
VSFWLLVALVFLFGRAVLMGAHRQGPLGARSDLRDAGLGQAQRELPGEAGEATAVRPSVLEFLPFP